MNPNEQLEFYRQLGGKRFVLVARSIAQGIARQPVEDLSAPVVEHLIQMETRNRSRADWLTFDKMKNHIWDLVHHTSTRIDLLAILAIDDSGILVRSERESGEPPVPSDHQPQDSNHPWRGPTVDPDGPGGPSIGDTQWYECPGSSGWYCGARVHLDNNCGWVTCPECYTVHTAADLLSERNKQAPYFPSLFDDSDDAPHLEDPDGAPLIEGWWTTWNRRRAVCVPAELFREAAFERTSIQVWVTTGDGVRKAVRVSTVVEVYCVDGTAVVYTAPKSRRRSD